MIGAIIGDIVGSVYEFHNIKTKEFPLYNGRNFFTDDTVMTLAIGKSLLDCKGDYSTITSRTIRYMQRLGQKYPYAGYGERFVDWIHDPHPAPYNSYGNGAGMRVSAAGIVGQTLQEVRMLARKVTQVSHNHPEGLLAGEAIAVAVFLARQGKTKEEIRTFVQTHYYDLNFTLDEIRPTYEFTEAAEDSTPQALVAFFESNSFEDALRNAISIGGDSDTIAAMTGAVAAEFYGVPQWIKEKAEACLDSYQRKLLYEFEEEFPPKIIEIEE